MLAELELTTQALLAADPGEPAGLEPLLARRQSAAAVVASGLTQTTAPQELARAADCWRQGELLRERLEVAGAGFRQQLRTLYSVGWHARALAGSLPEPGAVFHLDA